jgi:hypothetical protein
MLIGDCISCGVNAVSGCVGTFLSYLPMVSPCQTIVHRPCYQLIAYPGQIFFFFVIPFYLQSVQVHSTNCVETCSVELSNRFKASCGFWE